MGSLCSPRPPRSLRFPCSLTGIAPGQIPYLKTWLGRQGWPRRLLRHTLKPVWRSTDSLAKPFFGGCTMKRRNGFVGIALLGTLIVLMAADAAQAQRRGRRARDMDYGYYQQPVMDATIMGQDPSRLSYYPM